MQEFIKAIRNLAKATRLVEVKVVVEEDGSITSYRDDLMFTDDNVVHIEIGDHYSFNEDGTIIWSDEIVGLIINYLYQCPTHITWDDYILKPSLLD